LFIFFLIFFVIPPQKTKAQLSVPVYDALVDATIASEFAVANLYLYQTSLATGLTASKEFGFQSGMNPQVALYTNPIGATEASILSVDFIATLAAKTLLDQMTREIVEWINSGFSGGGPGFVTDPEEFLLNVADTTAGQFIDGTELGFLCSPFSADVRALLAYNYSVSFDVSCTLSDVLRNIDNFTAFTEDFSQGGWEGWFAIVQPQNNTYGSYIKAEAELSARISTRNGTEMMKLNWGSGFLSSQDCTDPPGAPLDRCKTRGPIKTPGKTIEAGLSDTLGMNLEQVGMADSMDKILNALINYAVTRALGDEGLGGIF